MSSILRAEFSNRITFSEKNSKDLILVEEMTIMPQL